jgi:hypothetical protein
MIIQSERTIQSIAKYICTLRACTRCHDAGMPALFVGFKPLVAYCPLKRVPTIHCALQICRVGALRIVNDFLFRIHGRYLHSLSLWTMEQFQVKEEILQSAKNPAFTRMFSLSAHDVAAAVHTSVPDIADHLLAKAKNNSGFYDNPKCIHPVTRMVTLSLDMHTRMQVEDALCKIAVEKSGDKLTYKDARAQLAFTLKCMQTLTYDGVIEAFGDAALEPEMAHTVWFVLEAACGRDGLEFLRYVRDEELSDTMQEASQHLVRALVSA